MMQHPTKRMARTVVSKAEYARLKKRSGACVSHWIKSGRITADSLVGSGRHARVWKERADADLQLNLNPVQQSLQVFPLRGLDDLPAVPSAESEIISNE